MAAAPDLTLDEAAEFLGLTTDEFKRRLKLHPAFKRLDVAKKRDGTSFRFPRNLVDEVGREIGAGSNAENPMPRFDEAPPDSDDFKIPAVSGGESPESEDEPIDFGSSADEDVFSLAADEPTAPPPKPAKGEADSDVRLDGGKPKKPRKGDDSGSVPTEEISIDFSGPGSAVIKGGSSAKLSAPKSSSKLTSDSGKSLSKPGVSDSSEFELSLDADSDDFELKLNADASDEVDLGELPKDKDGGGSGRRGGESGILSRKPADSGISLEKGKDSDKHREKGKDSDKLRGKPSPPPPPEDSGDSDVDFELTLDSAAAVSGTKLGGPKGKKPVTADSDSEFELTLDDASDSSLESAALDGDLGEDGEKGAGDIFETDFEIPPMDESGSEAVALDSSDTDSDVSDSDFEVELDDSDTSGDDTSGSEVVLLEDEEAEAPVKPKGRKKAAVEDEGDVDLADVESVEEEEDSVAGALKGVKHKPGEDDEEEEDAVGAGAYRPVPWGPLPALFLLPAMLLVLMGGLMGYELLQTMWGYQQPRKPAAPLVRAIASNFDMELKDQ